MGEYWRSGAAVTCTRLTEVCFWGTKDSFFNDFFTFVLLSTTTATFFSKCLVCREGRAECNWTDCEVTWAFEWDKTEGRVEVCVWTDCRVEECVCTDGRMDVCVSKDVRVVNWSGVELCDFWRESIGSKGRVCF